jgi:uncharacterized membrane protein YphA (DoxX/SURF4 family)
MKKNFSNIPVRGHWEAKTVSNLPGLRMLCLKMRIAVMLVPLLVFGVPLLDTARVMLGRMRRGAPIFQADQSHVHHHLLRLGLPHKEVAYFLYAITLLLGGLAIVLCLEQSATSALAGIALVMAVAFVIWRTWRIQTRYENNSHPTESCSNSKPLNNASLPSSNHWTRSPSL